jgi:hypothetical protein
MQPAAAAAAEIAQMNARIWFFIGLSRTHRSQMFRCRERSLRREARGCLGRLQYTSRIRGI